jgi:hypothetical protein
VFGRLEGGGGVKKLVSVAVLTTSILSVGDEAVGCSCVRTTPFLRYAAGVPVVVVGHVRNYGGSSSHGKPRWMDVQVSAVLKSPEQRTVIRVWGDDGYQCRPYVTEFPIGSTWVFALHFPMQEVPRSDYTLMNCGETSLSVHGDLAHGVISGESVRGATEHDMPLAELQQRLQQR